MICPKCGSHIPDDSHVCPNCGFSFGDEQQTFILSEDSLPEDVKLIKDKITDYIYMGIVGEGGFSTVYKIKHKKTGKICALKILSRKLLSNPEALKRFIREGKLYQKFNHPNIVKVYDVGSEGGIPFIIMEYIEGLTLKEYIQNNSPLELEEIVKISKDVVSVLDHLHKKGIVHRDIKPANIMITTKTKKAILTDFGIAKDIEGSKLTATGEIIGSPYYISPEQAKGEKIDGRSDIYSIGVTMYEMATGKLPFKGETPVQIIFEQVKKEELPRPSKYNEEIDPELEDIIIKAVRKDRNKRYSSAEELLRDLKKLEERIELGKPARKRINPFYPMVLILVLILTFYFYKFYDLKYENVLSAYKNSVFKKRISKILKIPSKPLKKENIKQLTTGSPNIKEVKKYKVTILTNKKAEISIDNIQKGFSPPEISEELQNGEHTIRAKFIDSGEVITKKIKVENKPINLLIEAPKFGFIKKIVVNPSGKIFIDGKFKGNSLISNLKLKPGVHILTASEKNYKKFTKKITIKPDEVIKKIEVNLTPIREEFTVMNIKFIPSFDGNFKYISQKIYLSSIVPPGIKGVNKLIRKLSEDKRISQMKIEILKESMCKKDLMKNTSSSELELCISKDGTPILVTKENNEISILPNISDAVLKRFKNKVFFKISLK